MVHAVHTLLLLSFLFQIMLRREYMVHAVHILLLLSFLFQINTIAVVVVFFFFKEAYFMTARWNVFSRQIQNNCQLIWHACAHVWCIQFKTNS